MKNDRKRMDAAGNGLFSQADDDACPSCPACPSCSAYATSYTRHHPGASFPGDNELVVVRSASVSASPCPGEENGAVVYDAVVVFSDSTAMRIPDISAVERHAAEFCEKILGQSVTKRSLLEIAEDFVEEKG